MSFMCILAIYAAAVHLLVICKEKHSLPMHNGYSHIWYIYFTGTKTLTYIFIGIKLHLSFIVCNHTYVRSYVFSIVIELQVTYVCTYIYVITDHTILIMSVYNFKYATIV